MLYFICGAFDVKIRVCFFKAKKALSDKKVKKTTFFCLFVGKEQQKNNTINRLFSSSSSFEGKTFE